MKFKEYLTLYLKSPLNLVLLTAALTGSVFGGWLLSGMLRLILPLACLVGYALLSLLIIGSRRGVGLVAGAQRHAIEEQHLAKIDEYAAIRSRLACLRLADEPLRLALESFLLVSGQYLEKCRELKSYSPAANACFTEVQECLQLYLEEKDETSTERRYQLADDDNFAAYQQRIPGVIKAAAETIRRKTREELTGLGRHDQLDIIEELKE